MADIIQLRGGSAAAWTAANPILAQKELGIETDTNKLKVGDGVTAWNSLSYLNTGLADAVANGEAFVRKDNAWADINSIEIDGGTA